jgi:hypothetical protein
MRPGIIASLLIVALWSGVPSAQQRRYVVTAEPLHLDLPTNPLCIAIDPADPQGVWWWEPGSSCRNRRTSDILHPGRPVVVRDASSVRIEVSFRIGLHSLTRPFVDVTLVVDEKGMGSATSDVRVPTEDRDDLDIPSFSGR